MGWRLWSSGCELKIKVALNKRFKLVETFFHHEHEVNIFHSTPTVMFYKRYIWKHQLKLLCCGFSSIRRSLKRFKCKTK